MSFPSTKQLVAEMNRVRTESPETPREHFERLVRAGFINRKGEVTRLLGGDAEPEPDYVPEPESH